MSEDMSEAEEEQYYYTHKVEVHLALSAVNISTPSLTRFAIETNNASLPNKKLRSGGSSFEVASNLFKKLTGTDTTWFPIHQVGMIDQYGPESNIIVSLYAVNIPDLVPLLDKSIHWADFDKISKSPKLLKLIGHACNAYKIGEVT